MQNLCIHSFSNTESEEEEKSICIFKCHFDDFDHACKLPIECIRNWSFSSSTFVLKTFVVVDEWYKCTISQSNRERGGEGDQVNGSRGRVAHTKGRRPARPLSCFSFHLVDLEPGGLDLLVRVEHRERVFRVRRLRDVLLDPLHGIVRRRRRLLREQQRRAVTIILAQKPTRNKQLAFGDSCCFDGFTFVLIWTFPLKNGSASPSSSDSSSSVDTQQRFNVQSTNAEGSTSSPYRHSLTAA